jgi:predicted GNAT family acetyltransferase
MIRKLNETFRYSLFKFLEKNPEINLFIIGDIENYGFDKDFQEIWGEYNDDGDYMAVLLRFRTHFVFYSVCDDYSIDAFCKIIESCPDAADLSGGEYSIRKFIKRLKFRKLREQHFARLSSKEKLLTPGSEHNVQRADIQDAEALYDLRQSIKEFSDFKTTLENVKEMLSDGSGRTFCAKLGGKIVAAASTTAETKTAAMVISVMTHPAYRRGGYATSCVYRLCRELLSEGKGLCLFYDNPAAGNIYRKLGFEDIGKWITLLFK